VSIALPNFDTLVESVVSATFPTVAIVASFASAIAAVSEMSASVIKPLTIEAESAELSASSPIPTELAPIIKLTAPAARSAAGNRSNHTQRHDAAETSVSRRFMIGTAFQD
jgi:hypothetical protein